MTTKRSIKPVELAEPALALGGKVRRRVHDHPAFRLTYSGVLATRILAGYQVIGLRHRLGLGVPDLEAAKRRQHRTSARRIYADVVWLQGLMIKIGQTIGSNPV